MKVLNRAAVAITKNDVRTGDILVTRKPGDFLSDCIREEMMKYARNIGTPCDMDDIFSHAGYLRWVDGKLIVYEAVENGFRPRIFDKHYQFNPVRNGILRFYRTLTSEETRKMNDMAEILADKNLLYQYWNLVQWLSYIHSKGKIDLFKKSTDKFLYCYEGAYRIRKAAFPDLFTGTGERTSIFDLYKHATFYEVIG